MESNEFDGGWVQNIYDDASIVTDAFNTSSTWKYNYIHDAAARFQTESATGCPSTVFRYNYAANLTMVPYQDDHGEIFAPYLGAGCTSALIAADYKHVARHGCDERPSLGLGERHGFRNNGDLGLWQTDWDGFRQCGQRLRAKRM